MREVVFPLLCWVQGLSLLRESFIFLFHHISQENFLKQKYLKDFLGQVKGGSCPLPPPPESSAPAYRQPQFRSTLIIFFWISYYLPPSQHLPLMSPQISTFKISFLTLEDGRTSTHTPTKDLGNAPTSSHAQSCNTHNLSSFPHQPQYQPHVTFMTSYIFLSLTPAQPVVLIGHIYLYAHGTFPPYFFFPQILILRLIFLFKALKSH